MPIPVRFSERTNLPTISGAFYQSYLRYSDGEEPSSVILNKMLHKYVKKETNLWQVFTSEKIKGKFPKSNLMLVLAIECSYVFSCTSLQRERARLMQYALGKYVGLLSATEKKHVSSLLALLSYLLVAIERNIRMYGEQTYSNKSFHNFFTENFDPTVSQNYEQLTAILASLNISQCSTIEAKQQIIAYISQLSTMYYQHNPTMDEKRNAELVYTDVQLHGNQLTGTNSVIKTGMNIGLGYFALVNPHYSAPRNTGVMMFSGMPMPV